MKTAASDLIVQQRRAHEWILDLLRRGGRHLLARLHDLLAHAGLILKRHLPKRTRIQRHGLSLRDRW